MKDLLAVVVEWGRVGLVMSGGVWVAGCTLPMKGELRTDVDAKPPAGEGVVAIKPVDVYSKKTIEQVELKPLMDAVAEVVEVVTGCWAVTVEWTWEPVGGEMKKTRYRVDPSKPPKQVYELFLMDNKEPTEEQRKALADRGLATYERFHKRNPSGDGEVGLGAGRKKGRSMVEELKRELTTGSCHLESAGGVDKYTILTGQRNNYKGGQGKRVEYSVDAGTGKLLRRDESILVGVKMYGVMGVSREAYDKHETFVVPEGGERSFPTLRRVYEKGTISVSGISKDRTGTTTLEFSDYKKVTCYDKRVRVGVGELIWIEEGEGGEK